MSSAWTVLKVIGRGINKSGWLIAILFFAITFGLLRHQGIENHTQNRELAAIVHRVKGDEQHTATVQKQGVPISVCLIEVFRNVGPLLERVPTVERPLQAYLTLQGSRYAGKRCPEKPGEAVALAKTLTAP